MFARARGGCRLPSGGQGAKMLVTTETERSLKGSSYMLDTSGISSLSPSRFALFAVCTAVRQHIQSRYRGGSLVPQNCF